MNKKYHFNRTGIERKELVQTISNILGYPAVYLGAPTFAYSIGSYMVDSKGVMECDSDADITLTRELLINLQEQGYIPEESIDNISPQAIRNGTALTMVMPKGDFSDTSLEKLKKIIASKASLLKLALGAETLEVQVSDDKLHFPWFTAYGIAGEVDAYGRLIAALVRMAETQKRVTATEKPLDNPKFTMRLFLIRLGFIGGEYKTARKILLRNLPGNSSWKAGHPLTNTNIPVTESIPTVYEEHEYDSDYDKGVHLMNFNQYPNMEEVKQVRKRCPVGCRVELISMSDPFSRLTPGTKGTVRSIDDTATIFVNWDTGSGLGVVYGVDQIRKI